jgi:hypothetical protein
MAPVTPPLATYRRKKQTKADAKSKQQGQCERSREGKRAHKNIITSPSQGGGKEHDGSGMKQNSEGYSKVESANAEKRVGEHKAGCCHLSLKWVQNLFARGSPS